MVDLQLESANVANLDIGAATARTQPWLLALSAADSYCFEIRYFSSRLFLSCFLHCFRVKRASNGTISSTEQWRPLRRIHAPWPLLVRRMLPLLAFPTIIYMVNMIRISNLERKCAIQSGRTRTASQAGPQHRSRLAVTPRFAFLILPSPQCNPKYLVSYFKLNWKAQMWDSPQKRVQPLVASREPLASPPSCRSYFDCLPFQHEIYVYTSCISF